VAEVEKLRQQIHDMQRDHAKTLAEKDAEITLLRARGLQLEASIAEPAFFEIRDGELKPMGEIR
jgi:hypothetical protein